MVALSLALGIKRLVTTKMNMLEIPEQSLPQIARSRRKQKGEMSGQRWWQCGRDGDGED